jgi:hypothetical protein
MWKSRQQAAHCADCTHTVASPMPNSVYLEAASVRLPVQGDAPGAARFSTLAARPVVLSQQGLLAVAGNPKALLMPQASPPFARDPFHNLGIYPNLVI